MRHYIFSTNNNIEETRLDILNRSSNQNTLSILHENIKPNMKVLECGFGEGQISDEVNKIENIDYIGFDNDLIRFNKRKEKDKYIYGDLLSLNEIAEIQNQKYDIIYLRWILAYLPQDKVSETIKKLYSYLNKDGKLILEECDLYKAHLVKNNKKITLPIFNDWIGLSRNVQNIINSCNFSMGSELGSILTTLFNKNLKIKSYQTILKNTDKEILTLGLKSSSKILIEKQILSEQELTDMIYNIESSIINDDKINLYYVENTSYIIKKDE